MIPTHREDAGSTSPTPRVPVSPGQMKEYDPRNDYTSKVPRFTFADSLTTQEEQLRSNPLLHRFAESRKRLASDPHRPYYHFVSPEGKLNDPNGLCYWQGRWHLFYQAYPPEDPRQHWGHAVSEDLIHWRDLPLAIYPHPERNVFSGTTLVENDRVIAIYHGVAAGTMVAVSHDPLLLNWEKLTGEPVIPFSRPGESPRPYNIHDPCIWKKDGAYYALTNGGTTTRGPGGKSVRVFHLHRSLDLQRWTYLHDFVDGYDYSMVGDDAACPYFWPIGDRHILLYFSHMSGGRYILGDYDTQRDKLIVTAGGRFNFGPVRPGGVHAPSATPDGKGGVIAIFNMNEGLPGREWNQLMTLPRRLTLIGNEHLGVEPAGEVESLRYDHRGMGRMTLPANQEVVLQHITGNAIELVVEIEPAGAPLIELDVLRSPGKEEVTRIMFFRNRGFPADHEYGSRENPRLSLISVDTSYSSVLPDALSRPPETADVFVADDEPVRLRVFIDKSVVEVFVNDRQCVAVRVYPARADSTGVALQARGQDAVLRSAHVWNMQNIYQ